MNMYNQSRTENNKITNHYIIDYGIIWKRKKWRPDERYPLR